MLMRRFVRSSALAAAAAAPPLRVHGGEAVVHSTPITSHPDMPLSRIHPGTLGFTRQFLDIHKLGDKAAIEKEKARLNDELNRGYFADIQEFNKHGGKVAMANKTIIPSVVAVKFPDLEVSSSDGKSFELPIICAQNGNRITIPRATLLCLSFRASSQIMTKSWRAPFLAAFSASGDIQIYEVSFVDAWFLSLSPIKRLMLRIMKKSSNPQEQIVYSFGDHYDFRKKLSILNLLTGYAFLLDRFGRIRWQGYGLATQEEISSLLSSTSLLLEEK